MKLLVTGSSGLVGSGAVEYFSALGFDVHGIDNNMRADFFGEEGDTRWNRDRLQSAFPHFRHHEVDIRDREASLRCVEALKPDLIIHAAAQPSHDVGSARPFDDFDVNAVGTLNLLEGARRHAPDAVFIHLSTNKVYGDRPNRIPLREFETRFDYDDAAFAEGIDESLPIDQSEHTVFGVSKVAADLMVQEYGRRFGLRSCVLRAGCLTGARHSGVEAHGFLNYLVRCNVARRRYTVYGYRGKQVRDNLHSFDLASFMHLFFLTPRFGEVYNIGGGRANSVSVIEAFTRAEAASGQPMNSEYSPRARSADHICYITDLAKIRSHYPNWSVTRSLDDIFREIHEACADRAPLPRESRLRPADTD